MDGTLGNERAPLQDGRECDYNPYYQHLDSLQSLNVIPSSTLTSILVRKVRVKQGTLCYHQNDENKYVDVSKDYEIYSNATILQKVNTKHREPEIYLLRRNFTQPYTSFLLEEGIRISLLVSRSLNLYDRIAELLCIHAELCEFYKVKHIHYDLWLDHFYNEYFVYFAYGE
ncbi:hypothetical protein Cgig2_028774 [Carnegiea gigantea]|uniref:Uncharacterized protein n=1 Tax=Carnegiea gigantea TaxID=171969 RepID=A0A9Q1Q631_9CARY|nr:hypothetical protein Cgig2_028774 [Carnegiea gigantea]